MMAFLIELTQKKTGEKLYAGAVVGDLPTHRIRRTHPEVTRHIGKEVRLFSTLEEAKQHGFPSTQEAKIFMLMMQQHTTPENVDYKIVKIH
jgi:hypothetical protein